MRFRYLYFVLFFALSFVEVRVHAELVTSPRNCLKGLLLCTIESSKDASVMNFGAGEIRLLRKSQVTRINAHRIKVIGGDVLIKAGDRPIFVETLYARFEVKNGEAMVSASPDKVVAKNLTSRVTYSILGSREKLDLPAGLQNDFGPVDPQGLAKTQYPRSLPLTGLIETWARFFVRSEFEIFKKDFEAFLPKWRESLNFVGPWYLETVNRQLADQREEEERRARLKAKRESEENYYREMFRRKNFLE